jgi:hypothetical protein
LFQTPSSITDYFYLVSIRKLGILFEIKAC